MKPKTRRGVAVLLACLMIVLCAGAGVGTWLLVGRGGPQHPEISAYSHGHLTRVGPYLYCNVLNLEDCETPQSQGELPVSERYPIQLSVPDAIARAPGGCCRCTRIPATRPAPSTARAPGSR